MQQQFDRENNSHRRYNLLTDEWVLVSPQRSKRPWLGQTEKVETKAIPTYVEDCFLCPGNTRMGGEVNPAYEDCFVFGNDFAALQPSGSESIDPLNGSLEWVKKSNGVATHTDKDSLLKFEPECGVARVICYSPDHSKTLPELDVEQISQIIDCWISQALDLGQCYPYVQIFENKGAVMGCSIPHPHGQVWAQESQPTAIRSEQIQQAKYFENTGKNLLSEYVQKEVHEGERIVTQNEDWLVVVPFWASWPFETLLLPKFPVSRLSDLTTGQKSHLAEILKILTVKYDNLFECSFPYSMGWHGAPFDGQAHSEWLLHAHFYPPLLRSASVRKFMVGYEMLAEPQRDITPEQAASRLAQLDSIHYKLKGERK